VKIPGGLEDLFENPVRNIVEINSIGDPNLEDQRNFEAVNRSEEIINEQELEIPNFLNPEPSTHHFNSNSNTTNYIQMENLNSKINAIVGDDGIVSHLNINFKL
jgi:hypothetical protein